MEGFNIFRSKVKIEHPVAGTVVHSSVGKTSNNFSDQVLVVLDKSLPMFSFDYCVGILFDEIKQTCDNFLKTFLSFQKRPSVYNSI